MSACPSHPEVADGVRECFRCGRGFCPDCLVTLAGHGYCARCKVEQLRDLHCGIDSTRLDLASLEQRLGAQIADGFLVSLPLFAAIGVFAPASRAVESSTWLNVALVLAPLVLFFVYEGLMLSLSDGRTFGKRGSRLKVVSADGGEIRPSQAWLRAGVRALLSLGGVTYWTAPFTRERTCIHDLLARTRVVRWEP